MRKNKQFIEVLIVEDSNRVVIKTECCKGCELCIGACPRGVLEMSVEFNRSGYHYSIFKYHDKCNSCTFCAIICPDVCIEVYR
jgi:2-oxoglutarate ferredoxin oxidoreductase subunit delta